ncbi:unnamed protein product [Schistosoma curassoni]|uniref:Transposase n=1 Tax=Schistosoma curassoni TaxID=6186 RepID=A0A183K662_9TREM|nr:unnamed protein product [Schistosoma curassoni]
MVCISFNTGKNNISGQKVSCANDDDLADFIDTRDVYEFSLGSVFVFTELQQHR